MPVPEANGAVDQGENPVVGDGDAVDVASEVAQYLARPVESRPAEDDPFPLPDLCGKLQVGQRLPCEFHEPRTEDLRECPNRDEETLAGFPTDAVLI